MVDGKWERLESELMHYSTAGGVLQFSNKDTSRCLESVGEYRKMETFDGVNLAAAPSLMMTF